MIKRELLEMQLNGWLREFADSSENTRQKLEQLLSTGALLTQEYAFTRELQQLLQQSFPGYLSLLGDDEQFLELIAVLADRKNIPEGLYLFLMAHIFSARQELLLTTRTYEYNQIWQSLTELQRRVALAMPLIASSGEPDMSYVVTVLDLEVSQAKAVIEELVAKGLLEMRDEKLYIAEPLFFEFITRFVVGRTRS